jgi:hypothetical protein
MPEGDHRAFLRVNSAGSDRKKRLMHGPLPQRDYGTGYSPQCSKWKVEISAQIWA